jgi:site-specific DNA-adenine methylase
MKMSKPLKPFFSYFGSKYRLSKKYPAPTKPVLIEPFAGSACYALHYPHKQVKLFDKYDVICSIWDYLINVSESELLSLPLIDFDKSVDDYNICQEAKYLIGYFLADGRGVPSKKHTSRSINKIRIKDDACERWTNAKKAQIANQLEYIRHWKIEQKSYEEIENEDATWFIDPPYQVAGKKYKESSRNIDFDHLGTWCKQRQGEIIVCENAGATWLPFEYFADTKGVQNKKTQEVVYYQGITETQLNLFGDENE